MKFFKALLLLIIIPILGFLASKLVISVINTDIAKEGINYTISELCSPEILSKTPELKPMCNEVKPIFLMQYGAIISGIGAIALLLSFVIAATIAGKSRSKITKIFPPLVFLSLIALAVLVLLQGAILTYGAYVLESTLIHRVHFFLIGGIGLGALIGGISLIGSSIKLASKQTHPVMGLSLDSASHPKIFAFVDEIVKKLGARTPDNITVGLEPNFYVTSADVHVIGEDKVLSGQTLFLSLPLARIFTKEEIRAVIGHELGHFRGQDTYYSLKFSPVYAGLSHAIASMESDEGDERVGGATSIATLPALIVLSYMIDVFHRNVSTIAREREFEADKAAAEVAEPQALATSLLKISLYAHAWNNLQKNIFERLTKGKITRNLSQLFSSIVKFDVNKEKLPEIVNSVGEETIPHPTDSHPPTASRIQALGIDFDNIDYDLLLLSGDNSIDLIEGYFHIEEKLTELQQQYYVALGVQVPDEEEINYGAKILAAFGAHMVLADGKVEAEEIDSAESIGMELTEDFDHIEFREYCHYPEHLPKIDELIEASKEIDVEAKKIMYEYLQEIANADDELSKEEQGLLDTVKSGLGL